MESTILLIIILLATCQSRRESKIAENNLDTALEEKNRDRDSLFKLELELDEDFVRIIAPERSGFELPDSTAKTEPYKFGDFNADNKEDVLIYLGACGTGGCMYGLFLNQYENYYKLVFMDYLKNAVFKTEKNGFWSIESSEEMEPYNPSKIKVTIFKFDEESYAYKVDSTFEYIDNGEKK